MFHSFNCSIIFSRITFHVAEVGSSASRFWSPPFPLIDRHDGWREGEDEDGKKCSFCFIATSGHTGCHFFAVNRFLVLLRKLGYVFVHSPADHNPRLSSVFLHGVDLTFNSITFLVIRNFDFQHSANCCISSNKSFRFESFVTWSNPSPANGMSWMVTKYHH